MRAKTKTDGGAIAKANNRKRFWLSMLIIAILGCFTGVAVGVYFMPAKADYSGLSAATLKDDIEVIKREARGKTPIELGATKAGALAFEVTFNCDRVQVIGEGWVKAAIATQVINAKTIRMNDKHYSENISTGFLNAIDKSYMVDGVITSYKGDYNSSDKSVTWNTTPVATSTTEEYQSTYDSTLFEYMKYIISSKTVISATAVTKNADGNYEFTLTLDKVKGVVNYVKTMKDTGGLSDYPVFTSEPSIKLIIDSQYRVIQFTSNETYKVKKGIWVDSTATLTNTFTYDQDFEIPALDDKSYI